MELLTILLILGSLIIVDVLAMRFGVNSRSPQDRRPNWW